MGCSRGLCNQERWTNCNAGYLLSGPVTSSVASDIAASVLHFAIQNTLDSTLEKFWSIIETLGIIPQKTHPAKSVFDEYIN